MFMIEQDEKIKGSVLDVESLKRKNTRFRELSSIIYEILRRINDELIAASREGKIKIISSIPSTYAISGIPNATCQSIAYGTIINILEKKGYTVIVEIDDENGKCTLEISWDSRHNDESILNQHYLGIIEKHVKKQ